MRTLRSAVCSAFGTIGGATRIRIIIRQEEAGLRWCRRACHYRAQWRGRRLRINGQGILRADARGHQRTQRECYAQSYSFAGNAHITLPAAYPLSICIPPTALNSVIAY